MSRRTALTGGAAGVAAFILNACGGGKKTSSTGTTTAAAAGTPAAGVFGSQPKLKFVLVNHVTTNPFFVPTQYGAEDACKLLGCSYQWTGSQSSNVNEMVNAFNSAITAQANGIGVCADRPQGVQRARRTRRWRRRSRSSPTTPTRPATTGWPTSARTCSSPARRWASTSSSSSPRGDVALFIATPGSLNIQPRIDGAQDTHQEEGQGRSRRTSSPPAPTVPAELSTIDAYCAGPPEHEGHVRRRRRQHPDPRPGDPEAQACARRASRAAATTSRRTRRSCWPRTRSTSRSTSSRTCRASCRSCSCTCTRRPGR